MRRPRQRSITELLEAYHGYILSKVSKVSILGDPTAHILKDVFVELSVVDQRTRQQGTEFLGMMDAGLRQRFSPFPDRDMPRETPGHHGREIKPRLSPDELLRRRTDVVVTTILRTYALLRAKPKGSPRRPIMSDI